MQGRANGHQIYARKSQWTVLEAVHGISITGAVQASVFTTYCGHTEVNGQLPEVQFHMREGTAEHIGRRHQISPN